MMESFQSIGVTKDWRPAPRGQSLSLGALFPINRRHQGLATNLNLHLMEYAIFQSIGVTKDWRLMAELLGVQVPCDVSNQ